MRVKIGKTWHEAKINVPIMIELTDQDLVLIKSIRPKECAKYAVFDEDDLMTVREREDWMELKKEE